MDNFKQASLQKLRFQTTIGNLSTEQLWDLTQTQLSSAIKGVKKLLKDTNDDELSFLSSNVVTATDKENTLRFEILKDVYLTKQDQNKALLDAKVAKEHNQKILALIADKKDESLKTKSIEELEALLK